MRGNDVHPEVMPLGIRLDDVRLTNAHNPFQDFSIIEDRPPEINPIIPPQARYHVVDGHQGESLMIKVSISILKKASQGL